MDDLRPVPFVVGVGRSGTTLLRLMLDAHPDMAIPHETGFLEAVRPLLNEPAAATRSRFVQALTCFPTWPDLGTTVDELQRAVAGIEPFTVADGLRAFFRDYAARRGKSRWGEKSPLHLGSLELLFDLLPEGKAIHVLRDGRDVAVSMRTLWFRPGDTIEELATSWRDQILDARRAAAGSERYLEVAYERLVVEPDAELSRICAFIDLPFDAGMLTYHVSARSRLAEVRDRVAPDGRVVITKDDRLHNHRFTSQPPTAERIGRWRADLTPDERATFWEVAGDLLTELDYTNATADAGAGAE